MNNPIALVIFFFAIVAIWGTFILTILIFLKGSRIGEDTSPTHGDDSERTTSG